MTAVELVETLRARGVELARAGGRLRFRPGEAVTAEERTALRQLKAQVLALLADPPELARVLALPLAGLDRVLTVRVPWLDVPLYFVPTPGDVEDLVAAGVSRGAVWTRTELLDLWSAGLTKAGAQTVAEARLALDGEVTEVRPAAGLRPWSDWPASLPGLGAKTVGPFDLCACGVGSWVRYGGQVLCLACARHKDGGR